jgi:DNA-binding LacI/PurR family transcriptional regulator
MPVQRVTIYDIAKRLAISHTTVSLALRNHHRIPEHRRNEIKKLAAEMGYAPDPALSRLASQRFRPVKIKNALAWFNHWDKPENLFKQKEFQLYWRGAKQAAKRFGYSLEEIKWSQGVSARRCEQILLARGIKGILLPPHPSVPNWADFDWNKFSVIRFGMSVPNPDSHLVTSDQLRAVVMAVKKISEYGYRRIGLVVCEDYDRLLGGSFIGGFASSQHFFRLPVLPPLLTDRAIYLDQPAQAQTKLQHWLEKNRPDAILTAVAQVVPMLQALCCRIPEDLAVAGTSLDVPVDAGIDQHSEAIGRMAVELLVSQINLNERGEPRDPSRLLVEARWRDGKSMPPKSMPNALKNPQI